jgi:outer membrane lipoprotein LolB
MAMCKLVRLALLLEMILFLSGCAHQNPPLPRPIAAHIKAEAISSDQISWDIHGAISVQSKNNVQMGNFTWKQINQRYAINIYGPLNLGSIGIQGLPGRVTLFKPTGSYSAPTPEALMQQQLGWYMPISNMYYWVRGLPAPGKVSRKVRNNSGQLIFLRQEGWNIRFQAFQPVQDMTLPRKIEIENPYLRIKLVITEWNMSSK